MQIFESLTCLSLTNYLISSIGSALPKLHLPFLDVVLTIVVAEGLKIRRCTYQYKVLLIEQVLLFYLAKYLSDLWNAPGHFFSLLWNCYSKELLKYTLGHQTNLKCSSLTPPRGTFNKTQWAMWGVKLIWSIWIFTSKQVWKSLIKIQLTKSNLKITNRYMAV